jgi:hypothetical protein
MYFWPCDERLVRLNRQLEHSRALTRAKPGHQNDLAVGELESVMVCIASVHIDLAKASDLCTEFTEAEPWQQASEWIVGLSFIVERDLGAGKQAYGHGWLANCGKAACE